MTGGVRLALICSLLATLLMGCSSPPSSSVTPLHRSTVLIEHENGHGSGLIIGPDRVLTAHHVVQGDALGVRFFNGEDNAGSVIWSDPDRDLALVDVDIPSGHPTALLSCEQPKPGQHVIAVGHPIQSQWVLTGGYLPNSTLIAGRYVSLGFPVGLGTSGGPVFDEQGHVVGMTLAILAERATEAAYDEFKDTGIGLMLPSSEFCHAVGVTTTAAR
ncbi:MAG: S1C family serine protease [Geminicoccaceae bacterium]